MEAASLYENFEQNLITIQKAFKSDIPFMKTALPEAVPLELLELSEVLNQGGAGFVLKTRGLPMVDEFMEQFRGQHGLVMEILRRNLEDKRSTVWVEGIGSLLVKEVVIRRLEYLNEAAALLDAMLVQRQIGNQRVLAAYNDVAADPNKTYRKKVS